MNVDFSNLTNKLKDSSLKVKYTKQNLDLKLGMVLANDFFWVPFAKVAFASQFDNYIKAFENQINYLEIELLNEISRSKDTVSSVDYDKSYFFIESILLNTSLHDLKVLFDDKQNRIHLYTVVLYHHLHIYQCLTSNRIKNVIPFSHDPNVILQDYFDSVDKIIKIIDFLSSHSVFNSLVLSRCFAVTKYFTPVDALYNVFQIIQYKAQSVIYEKALKFIDDDTEDSKDKASYDVLTNYSQYFMKISELLNKLVMDDVLKFNMYDTTLRKEIFNTAIENRKFTFYFNVNSLTHGVFFYKESDSSIVDLLIQDPNFKIYPKSKCLTKVLSTITDYLISNASIHLKETED